MSSARSCNTSTSTFSTFAGGVTQIRFSAADEYFFAFRKFNGDGAGPPLYGDREMLSPAHQSPLSRFIPSLFIALSLETFSSPAVPPPPFLVAQPPASISPPYLPRCDKTLPRLITFITRPLASPALLCIFSRRTKREKKFPGLMTKVR